VGLVLPKLSGIELAVAATEDLTQPYTRTKKALHRMMDGSLEAQQNYAPKISSRISGKGWIASGWDGLDLSSARVLSSSEAATIASLTNVIDIPADRRSDVPLRAFAYVNGVYIPVGFSTSVNEVTVSLTTGATQYMVGWYPEFSAFIEIDLTGRQGWTLTAEEV
jgi:hypothetical protein